MAEVWKLIETRRGGELKEIEIEIPVSPMNFLCIHIPTCHTPEAYLEKARLMASAPMMLDALNSAEHAVAELCQGQDPANECWNTLAAVRSAILKARGKLPFA